jgi:hypothetical protein
MYASGKAPKKCIDCKTPMDRYGLCDSCKRLAVIVNKIHDDARTDTPLSAEEMKAGRLAIHRGRLQCYRERR